MFRTEISGDIWMLRLSGDVTGAADEESVLHLANQAIAGGIRIGVVDISEVRFMNSSGIAVLLRLLNRFRQKDGEVYLMKPPDQVRKLLLMTRLEAIFRIINSPEDIHPAGGKP